MGQINHIQRQLTLQNHAFTAKLIRYLLTFIGCILFLLSIVTFHGEAVNAAGLKGEACSAASTAQVTNCSSSSSNDTQATSFVGGIVRNIINTLSYIVGAVAVIMIIVGGFRYVASAGDSNSIKGAKDTIIYALIGLVVALFAQVIARFVLSKIG